MDNDDILKTSIQTNNKKETTNKLRVKKSRTAEGWPKWPCLVLIIVIEKNTVGLIHIFCSHTFIIMEDTLNKNKKKKKEEDTLNG